MSWINPFLLFGLGLGIVPVILHFLLRSKPRKLVFPALQLIKVRRRQNIRRMRLRHLWLLLLRILVIVLLVLALARPSLPPADYGLTLSESLMLAAVVAVGIIAYAITMMLWKRSPIPNHVMNSRRTFLRGTVGIVTILLLLLLVVWPYQQRVAAEITAPVPDALNDLPVTAVFLFDTSQSMQYREESKTRLDRAQEIAIEQIGNLPARSRVAVGDTSSQNPILFQADLPSAQTRIESLEIRPIGYALNDRLRVALMLQDEDRGRTLDSQGSVPVDLRHDRSVREIYLFTDLARSAWKLNAAKFLRGELARLEWVNVYLIDVGAESPKNISIRSIDLSQQTVAAGRPVYVDANVSSTGFHEADRRIEIYVRNEKNKLVKRDHQTVTISDSATSRVRFRLDGLTGPLEQGEIRLISSDPLSDDDVRYFTIEVRPPPRVLVVAPQRDEADYLLFALAPPELQRQGRARYQCKYLPLAKFAEQELGQYDCICLVNAQSLDETSWNKLAAYVDSGGGVAVVLGRISSVFDNAKGIDPLSYNSAAAQSFLPAKLDGSVSLTDPVYLDLSDLTHPILKKFEEDAIGGAAPLAARTINKYWSVEPDKAASIIARYTNRNATAAILERSYGHGRTVMLTTAADINGWNELPRSWQFLVFTDQLMHYLSGRGASMFNYIVGDTALIRLDRNNSMQSYLLVKPGMQQIPGKISKPGARRVSLTGIDQAGNYELLDGNPGSRFKTGFSANASAAESDFTRLSDVELNSLFGEKRYSVARDIDGLTRRVSDSRLGREVYSLILLLVVVFFCGEHLVANRFYLADQQVTE